MRIGLFTDAYFPIISGVTVSVRTLRDELVKLGHEVYIITNDHDDSIPEDNVVRVVGKKLPMKAMGEFRVGKVTNKKVKELGDMMRLDVVHCHTEFTMGRLGRRIAKKYNLPIVHTYHTMYEEYIHFITKAFARPLRFVSKIYSRRFAEKAHQVIFPTVKVQRTFLEYGYTKPSVIIPTGIYLEQFSKDKVPQNEVIKVKEKLGIRHDEFVMLFLGRISREKSIEELIREFSKIENDKLKLLIVGGGPDSEWFQEVAEEVGVRERCVFTGMIDPKEVALYYHTADLFVNFSMSETQGLTYYEALACCVPLLVKYDHNLEGVVEDGINGYTFTKDDDFPMLSETLLSNQKLLNELKENACSSVEKYSAQNYAKNIESVYEKVLAK